MGSTTTGSGEGVVSTGLLEVEPPNAVGISIPLDSTLDLLVVVGSGSGFGSG